MVVRLPTTRLDIPDERFRSLQEIRSGDATADEVFGMRGVNSQANHAYAYRVHTLVAEAAHDLSEIYDTTSNTETTVFGPVTITFGADVETIRLVTLCEQCDIILRVYDGSSWDSTTGSVTTKAVDTRTRALNTTTGVTGRVEIRFSAKASQTGKIYALVIQEVVLASGDLP